MYNVKKVISVFVISVCLIVFPVFTYADAVSFSLDKNSINAAVGDTFNVSVNTTDAENIDFMYFVVKYDKSVFSLKSASIGTLLQNTGMTCTINGSDETGDVLALNRSTNSFSGSGQVLEIQFGVNEGAPIGSHTIRICGDDTERISYYPNGQTFLPFQTRYGGYTITGSTSDLYHFENMSLECNISNTGSSDTPDQNSCTASLSLDKTEAYNVGDTVKVTAALTPSQAASLSAGSVKFTYDTELLEFKSAVVSDGLTQEGEGIGSRATAENGVAVASFTTATDSAINVSAGSPLNLAVFSFTAKKTGTASLTVTEAVAADADAESITVSKPEPLSVAIENSKAICQDYGSDYKLVKYTADKLPDEGKAYMVGNTTLTYVPAYATGDNTGKHVFVGLAVSGSEPTDLTVTESEGSYNTILAASGDANMDNDTNIIDAQVVIYMVGQKITSQSGDYNWLNSDANGDGLLNTLDAQAIQYYVHYGIFGQFS